MIQNKSKKRKAKRAEDVSGLPKEIINHDFSENELRMLYPDEEWKKQPDEVYHRYSFTPAKIALEEHHVAIYSGKKTEHMEKTKHPGLSAQRQSGIPITGNRYNNRKISDG